MAQYKSWANFVAYFSDPAEYNLAVAAMGGNTAEVTPADIASMFDMVDGVNFNTGGAINPDKGMYGFFPYSLGQPDPPGVEVNHPAPSGKFMKFGTLSVLVPGQAVGTFPVGPDMLLTWSVNIVKISEPVEVDNNAPVPIRRWIGGFEFNSSAEGGASGGLNNRSRDASRVLEGVGWGLRNPNGQSWTRTLDEYGAASNNATSWERFYFRIRNFGTANNIEFWQSQGQPSGLSGIVLRLTTTGGILVNNRNSGGIETNIETIPNVFTTTDWNKIDLIVSYNTAPMGDSGRFRLWVNSVLLSDNNVSAASGGIGQNSSRHASSILGTQNAATAWEWDFDDWHNAETPKILGVESLTSIDWLVGTHCQSVKINTGTKVNWTGPFQSVNQMYTTPNLVQASNQLLSTTALAQIVGVTEANDDFNRPTGIVLSQAAVLVSSWSRVASGNVAGSLGYSIAGGAAVMGATIEGSVGIYNSKLFKGTGTDVLPPSIVPLSVIYEKANNVISTNVNALSALVQYIGVWGLEDSPEFDPELPRTGINHNAYWPLIAQAFLGPTPDGPIAIQSGTFVGNGVELTVPVVLPFHFLWIRNVTNPISNGVKWYGTNLSGHFDGQGKSAADVIPRVDFDPLTGISSFTVVGNDINSNANGSTYQYVAFCDPSFQYLLCGAFSHAAGLVSAVNPFINPNFNPVCGFFIFDRFDNDAVVRLIYKGPGNTVNAGIDITGIAIVNCATFNVGSVISRTGTHNVQENQTAYALFQTGNQCETVMVQAYSYIGNGAGGTRVINSTPVSGRFPCFVYVQPSNNIGFVKDPSDVGVNSRQVTGGGNSTTAITAVGNDTITVGITLNANGIVYNVFIFPGSTVSFSNGIFQPGNCEPEWVEIPPPEVPPPGVNVLGNGGLTLNGQVPLTLLLDVSGIYTIVPGKTNDTLYDRQLGQPNVDVAIPNPRFKTGYIGG